MSAKDVKFSVEVRTKMLRGIDILAAAVKVTQAQHNFLMPSCTGVLTREVDHGNLCGSCEVHRSRNPQR
jgi:hypothetical protein